MTKERWYNELYEFGIAINGKYNDVNDDGSDNDNELINVKIDINITVSFNGIHETVNENKEFSNKRDLYNYYGIDIITIPDGYVVKMRYIKVKGKRSKLYKLAKK